MNITIFDLETTGLEIPGSQLVSVYAHNKKLGYTIDTLTKPTIPIPKHVSDIHGITDDMVANSFSNEEVLTSLANLINKSDYISGWNIAGFDIPLTIALCDSYGIYIDKNKKYLDMKYVAKLLLSEKEVKDEIKTYSLVNVYKYLFNEEFDAHRAKDDVTATIRVMKKLAPFINEDDLLTSQAMYNEVISDMTTKCIFDKHLGETYEEIAKNDKSYIDFLVSKNKIKLSNYK